MSERARVSASDSSRGVSEFLTPHAGPQCGRFLGQLRAVLDTGGSAEVQTIEKTFSG